MSDETGTAPPPFPLQGGAAKKPASKPASKKAGAKKPASKKVGAKKGKKVAAKRGGGFVSDVSGLAIPLGLIAAREGISALYKKKHKKSPSSSSSSSSGKRRSVTTKRRRAVGGGHALSPAPFEGGAMKGGSTSMMPIGTMPAVPPLPAAAAMPAIPPPMAMPAMPAFATPQAGGCGTSACASSLSGGSMAQKHAMVAEEFRRMAAEIGSFLKARKPVPKKKPAAPKKKPAAAPKKKKSAAAPKKKKMLGGFFDAY
jgi:hypothetical protein